MATLPSKVMDLLWVIFFTVVAQVMSKY